ncbi:MAG: hypothetical protein LC648_07045 [Novosphingobium sp.]|nr:hypothetical protein [Novosphingobium sp.]
MAAAPGAIAPSASGRLMTLALGRYQCERPALPGQPGAIADRAASFAVTSSSRYIAADGSRGTYLFTGDTVTMTSGPLAGTRLVRLRQSFLRKLEADGVPGEVRCVLSRNSDRP